MLRSWRKQPPAASPVASREILRQVQRLELRTRRLVDSRFSGEYRSIFKGQGIEFAEVREYQPGDDVRAIDWNVTARLGRPFVKRFEEERELTVLLVVDLSGSQRWGMRGRSKSELVAEVAATLAMSATRNNDRVGMLLLTDRVEWFVPPRKGRRHGLRLIRDLLAFEPRGRGTDLGPGLDYASRLIRSRAILFVFSDFQLGNGWDAFEAALRRASVRHDVVAVHLSDPVERQLPDVGLLSVEDPESGEHMVLNTSRSSTRRRYERMVEEEEARAQTVFKRHRVDRVALRTDSSYTGALIAFFRRREGRLHR